jgi:erythromycin esterase-like protein
MNVCRVLALLPAVALAQTNLSFLEGDQGSEPGGWIVPAAIRSAGYSAEIRHEGCRTRACAVLLPGSAPPPGAFGNLMQSFDPAAYLGKTVRLRAWIRVEPSAPSDRAQMWLRVDPGGFYDNMGDRPVTSSEWRQYEITGDVAPDSRLIGIGVMSFGKPRVWVDDVSFEVVSTPAAATAEARRDFEELYAQVDAAYTGGDTAAIAALATPDAQIRIGSTRLALSAALAEIRAGIQSGSQYRSKSTVTSVSLANDGATISVNNESTLTSQGAARVTVTVNRDTWVKTPAGWKLKESSLITHREVTPPTDVETAAPVIAELKQRAIPLAADFSAFGRAIGNARIVALGEAAYGTREFFELKRRLLEYLVKEKGFTVFAIEANWPDALAVDRYIKTGEGDPKAALPGIWHTAEMFAVVGWMREFNKAPGKHPILTFSAFDMQSTRLAAQRALAYLKQYAPDEAGPAEVAYTEAQDLEARRAQMFDEGAAAAAAHAASVLTLLDSRHAQLVAASSTAAWRDARQAAAIVYQACTMRIQSKGQGYHDEAMAGNVAWLASEAYPNEKIVLWAHNSHVAFGAGDGKPMGAWVRQRYGKQYYAVGFGFRRGQLRAIGSRGGQYTGMAVQIAPESPEGSGDAILSGAGVPLFFLDMARVPTAGPLGEWLAETHLFHEAGLVWNLDDPDSNLQPKALSKLYDGLIFIEETHAPRGL